MVLLADFNQFSLLGCTCPYWSEQTLPFPTVIFTNIILIKATTILLMIRTGIIKTFKFKRLSLPQRLWHKTSMKK